MGRRSDHSREELRRMALDAARAIVEEDGAASLSVRKITGRIGYTVGTLYNLYANLDDVILHLNAETLEALYQKLHAAIAASTNEQAGPLVLANAYIDFSKAHFSLWALLLEHRLPPSQELPVWYREHIEKVFALIEKVLLPVMGGKEDQAKQAAKVLWAGLHGICTLSLSGKLDTVGADSAQILADKLITYYIAGAKQSG